MNKGIGPKNCCDRSTSGACASTGALIKLRGAEGGRFGLNGLSPARVGEIRGQIAAGTYLTDEKLDIAVDRLLAVLRRDPRRTRTAVA